MRDERLVLDLSRAEALILFDHEAEQRVVWSLESQLEKALLELFGTEYRLKPERARDRGLDGEGLLPKLIFALPSSAVPIWTPRPSPPDPTR